MKCIEKFNGLLPKVEEMIGMGFGRYKIANALCIKENQARALIEFIVSNGKGIEKESVINILAKQQNLCDKRRVARKETREYFRGIGVLEEIGNKVKNILETKNMSKLTVRHTEPSGKNIGIIQISDTHFNELIDIGTNKYNFDIAAKRLFLLAEKSKKYFMASGVTDVLIAMTGDMLNSDRRMDEILNASTNRTKAAILAIDILQQFILDINREFNVSVAYVNGNESRVGKEIGWNDNPVTDSYDAMVFETLRLLFKNSDINFIEGDCSELVVRVGNSNILLMHGHGALSGSLEKSVEQIKGRFASGGVMVDYVLFGHIHSAIVGDHFSRSSSLCGSNAYNEKALNLRGRASQNIYVVYPDKQIDGIKVDLQIIEGKQYEVDHSLEAYNPKSEKKNIPATIIRVVG